MQLIAGILVLIVIAAIGLFLLFFSLTYAVSVNLRKASDHVALTGGHRKTNRLRLCGITLIVIAVLSMLFIRMKNLTYDSAFIETDSVAVYDKGNTSFSYDGADYVRLDGAGEAGYLPELLVGEAVVNVKDQSGIGKLSDLGCKVLNVNPYETMYLVESESQIPLLYGNVNGYFCDSSGYEDAAKLFRAEE